MKSAIAHGVQPSGLAFRCTLTGDTHLTNAHFAVLFGASWEHFRPTVGPSFHVLSWYGDIYSAVGLSIDLAVLFEPIVVALFADVGVLEAAEIRGGLRVGVSL